MNSRWKCKSFDSSDFRTANVAKMEEDINKWMEEHPGIDIKHVTHLTAHNCVSLIVMIFYLDS